MDERNIESEKESVRCSTIAPIKTSNPRHHIEELCFKRYSLNKALFGYHYRQKTEPLWAISDNKNSLAGKKGGGEQQRLLPKDHSSSQSYMLGDSHCLDKGGSKIDWDKREHIHGPFNSVCFNQQSQEIYRSYNHLKDRRVEKCYNLHTLL